MRFAVTIPFRPNGQYERERNCGFVYNHFKPYYDVFLADSGHPSFNRSASRNYGAGVLKGYDAIVICDADFVPPLDAVDAALQAAAEDGLLHQPFDNALYLSEDETYFYIAHRGLPDRWGGDLTGGCFVISPEAWFAAGGMDERFEGWGGEDDAFRIAAETLLGPRVHHEGVMPHLWHPSSAAFGTEAHRGNLALLRRYVEAEGNKTLMRSIINERR